MGRWRRLAFCVLCGVLSFRRQHIAGRLRSIFVAERGVEPDLGPLSAAVYPPPASVACIARCRQQLPLRFGVKAHQLRCFPCYRARIGPDTAIEKESGACFEQQRGVPETNRTSSCKNQRRHQVSCQIPETTQFAGFPPHQGLTARGDISTSVWFPCAYPYCAHRHKVPAKHICSTSCASFLLLLINGGGQSSIVIYLCHANL